MFFFCFICSFGFLLNVNKELPFLILHYQPVYVSECFFNWSSTHESLVLVNSIKKRKSYYMPYQLYINSHENTISFWVFLIPFYIKLITHETFWHCSYFHVMKSSVRSSDVGPFCVITVFLSKLCEFGDSMGYQLIMVTIILNLFSYLTRSRLG